MYEQEEQAEQENDEQLPSHIEIEGRKVFVGGLDYSQLEKQKKQNRNQNLLAELQKKISIISGNVFQRVQERKQQEQQDQEDDLTKRIVAVFNNKNTVKKNIKKTILCYEFDLDEDFGRKKPQIIQRWLGRAFDKPTYVNIEADEINEFSKLMQVKDIFDQGKKQNFLHEDQEVDQDSEDDIFGDTKKEISDIKIGRKLEFGIEEDIFKDDGKRKASVSRQQEIQEPDKYFFMRKKVKTNKNQDLDDGYGQCYAETGPSLKQMIELKKQGIQLFGDAKEFKPQNKKGPNINKQYDMVKKIIEKKYNK